MVRYSERFLFMALALMLAPSFALGQASDRLTIAVGIPGSDSFAFGTELWAMSELNLADSQGIGLAAREVAEDRDRLDLLHNNQVQAAIVRARIPASFAGNTRAIMALWPKGIARTDVAPARLLVRRDVDDDVVYSITKAIFKHADYMKSAHATLGIGQPDQAMSGLDVPIHPGAYRYYQERGFGYAAAASDSGGTQRKVAGQPTADHHGRDGAIETYSDFNDTGLNHDEIAQIIAACRHALDLGSLSAVLGDLSSAGCEVYQSYLVDQPDGKKSTHSTSSEPTIRARGAADDEHWLVTASTAAQNTVDELLDLSSGQGGPVIPVRIRTIQGRDDGTPSTLDRRDPAQWTRQPTM